MVRIVGVIGDEGTDDPKLMAGCFTGHTLENGEMRVYLANVFPCAVFYAGKGHLDINPTRNFETLESGKEPQYYYPTFDRPLDKRKPENTFKKRCTDLIVKRAKEVHDIELADKGDMRAGFLERYSKAAIIFMHKAEDIFSLNEIPGI
jgi:hypothetical protein